MTWLIFALMTVSFWGLYGVMLHSGVVAFGPGTDPNARYKAFLLVGVAYFITAVLAPLVVLILAGSDWSFFTNTKGVTWSLFAGVVGAAGAFCLLLAFGAKGTPVVVMSIVFAGAPIVNAIVAFVLHPPMKEGSINFGAIHPAFYAGIVLAALGGFLVARYKPEATKAPAPQPKQVEANVAGSGAIEPSGEPAE